ncbi:MAG TPA: ABC transporter ATP-binding protein [Gemmataceae bacterium]|nr:ABC transporter ATP-binding protein [Gemmataceae bacterium]
MSDVAIRVENLSKRYRRGIPTGNDRLSEAMSNLGRAFLHAPRQLWRRSAQLPSAAVPERSGDFWALQDVSFEVKSGEVVGIIGRNGAGKSTLLKILSRITEPTRGRFGLAGRVGSLLEVGTGFHTELTGRENIFLNGSLLGMSRAEVLQKFDEIAAFAEIDDFLDTPVKRYSSGMQMRLGFAVAAHLQPEILIVDEVLAVGDLEFQKKCLGKMDEVAKGGRTVLLVSHNMTAVRQLCRVCLWLESGRLKRSGPAEKVCRDYVSAETSTASRSRSWDADPAGMGNQLFRLVSAAVMPANGTSEDPITTRTPVWVELECETATRPDSVTVTLLFSLPDGTVAFGTSLSESPVGEPFLPAGRCRCVCEVPANLLNAGELVVSLFAVRVGGEVLFKCDNLLRLMVHDESDRRFGWYGRRVGVVRPQLVWHAAASQSCRILEGLTNE